MPNAGGGGGCTPAGSPSQECTTNDVISWLGNTTSNWYLGLIVESGEAQISVCSVTFQMGTNTGDTGGIVYEVNIWDLDGSNNLNGSATGTSGGQTGGFATGVGEEVTFTFSSAVTLDSGQALTVSRQGSADASNFARVYREITADGDSSYSHYARWNSSGIIQAEEAAQDIQYAIYAST